MSTAKHVKNPMIHRIVDGASGDASAETLPTRSFDAYSQLSKPGRLVRDIIDEYGRASDLAWQLFIRDLRAKYRQTAFGYVWAILPSLAIAAIWIFLRSSKIINIESPGVPYGAFVVIGILLWQSFLDALFQPMNSLQVSKDMLAKVNFPREAIIMGSLGQVAFNSLLRLIVIAGVMVVFQLPWHSTILLAPLGMLAVMLLGTAIGLVLLPLGGLYNDVENGLRVIAQFGFFLTPIVYPPSTSWPGSILNYVNPLTPLLLTTRDWLLRGTSDHLAPFAIVLSVTVALLLFGLLFYRLTMPIIIERMSA
jgi:lipopolysaccharide transport system permease protein